MPSAIVPGHGNYCDVWTIVCHYLQHCQPADLRAVSVACSSIAGVARAIIFRSLIVGPSNSFLVALSDTKDLDRGIPLPALSYIHTIRLNTSSPGEPDNTEQLVQTRLASCLQHLPLLSILSLECRHILSSKLEAISQLANIRPLVSLLSAAPISPSHRCPTAL